jgi:hypothetical protein
VASRGGKDLITNPLRTAGDDLQRADQSFADMPMVWPMMMGWVGEAVLGDGYACHKGEKGVGINVGYHADARVLASESLK